VFLLRRCCLDGWKEKDIRAANAVRPGLRTSGGCLLPPVRMPPTSTIPNADATVGGGKSADAILWIEFPGPIARIRLAQEPLGSLSNSGSALDGISLAGCGHRAAVWEDTMGAVNTR